VTDVYHLTTSLWLPQPRTTVFPFFADAHNLERVTPAFLIRSPQYLSDGVEAGALIDHRLRLHGMPIR
jgi:hypothetical protein